MFKCLSDVTLQKKTSTKFVQKLHELNKGKHNDNYLKETNKATVNHIGPYMTIHDQTGPYWSMQDHTGPNVTIYDHTGHTGPYRALWDHTGP